MYVQCYADDTQLYVKVPLTNVSLINMIITCIDDVDEPTILTSEQGQNNLLLESITSAVVHVNCVLAW